MKLSKEWKSARKALRRQAQANVRMAHETCVDAIAKAMEEAGRRVVFEDTIDSFQHAEFSAFDAWCEAFGLDDTPGSRSLAWDIYQQEVPTAVEWAMERGDRIEQG